MQTKTKLAVTGALLATFATAAASEFFTEHQIQKKAKQLLVSADFIDSPEEIAAKKAAIEKREAEIAPLLKKMNADSDSMVVEEFQKIYPDGNLKEIPHWQETMRQFNYAFLYDERSDEITPFMEELGIEIKTNFIGDHERLENTSNLILSETDNSTLTLSLSNEAYRGHYSVPGISKLAYELVDTAKRNYDENKRGYNVDYIGTYKVTMERRGSYIQSKVIFSNDDPAPTLTPSL